MRSANPRLSRLLALLLTLALLAGLMPAALADGGPETPDPTPEVATVQSVSVSASPSTIEVDGTSDLSATVTMSDGSSYSGSISWSVTNGSSYVDLSSSGSSATVTGRAAGTATITAEAGGQTGSATVTVNEPKTPEVKSITLDPTSLTFTVGDGAQTIRAEVSADEGADKTVTWKSDDNKVATVSEGVVTPVGEGRTTITATAGGKSATCSVEVKAAAAQPGISLSDSSVSLAVGGTKTITAAVQNFDASPTWTVEDSTVASISWNGNSATITANKAGTTTVKAALSKDVYATCTVTVTGGTAPTLSATKLSVSVGKSANLTVNNLPAGGSVTWSKSSGSALSLSGSGTSITLRGGHLASGRAENVTVTASVKDSAGQVTTLTCTVTVNPGTGTTLSYTVAAGAAKLLSRSDFQALCQSIYGYDLDYVVFQYSASKGTLYRDYSTSTGTGTRMTSSNCTLYASGTGSNSLDRVAFVPSLDATGTATVGFTMTDVNKRSISGTISFSLSAPTGSIKYTTGRNQAVNFAQGDFYDVCKKLTGYGLDYVSFSLPSSSRGVLYYNYDAKTGDYDSKLRSSDKCYYSAGSRDMSLDLVSFVPAKDWYGTVSISFTGYTTSSRVSSFQGVVEITVSRTETGADVSLKTGLNTALDLDDADFNSFCKDLTGSNLSYIRFTSLPSSSRGILYYKYDRSGEKEVRRNTEYYRSESPYIDDLTFVPAKDYEGTVTYSFTGRSTSGTDFEGTLVIQVGAAAGDVRYETASGSTVAFRSDDFQTFCKNETGSNLDYVTFDYSSGRKGYLYYRYGQSGQKEVGSEKYYRSGTSALDDLTFVPGSSTDASVSIPFSGKSTSGKSFSGSVSITFSNLKEPNVIRYASQGTAALFRSADFSSACSSRGGKSLVSVRFTLPDSTVGRLYYDYSGPTSYRGPVMNNISYEISGTYLLDKVAFVPRAGYSGLVSIQYTGTDAAGITYTGTVQISVSVPTASIRFSDMGSYGWAAPSADFLYQYGITTGTTATTYGPSLNITRGDFVLMLYRAFGFSASTTGGNFADVPADSYYAQAIAAAKALGIAQGSDGKFSPKDPLTRQDAMVLLNRTLEKTGRTLTAANSSYLTRFRDGASVASYAQSAVATLANAGVIQGDNNGNVNPTGTLSRAEMAVILHRVLTL